MLDGGIVKRMKRTSPGNRGNSKCPQGRAWIRHRVRRMELLQGNASMAKHIEEVDTDVGCVSSQIIWAKWTSRAKLSWRRTKAGKRRARLVGSGGTRPRLPTTRKENM
eukprot:4973022-Amphidinium_carterae.1